MSRQISAVKASRIRHGIRLAREHGTDRDAAIVCAKRQGGQLVTLLTIQRLMGKASGPDDDLRRLVDNFG